MKRILRITLWFLGGIAALVLLAVIAGLITMQTPWFRDKVRARIVYEIESATGGRAEIGRFSFDWRQLTAQVNGLVIHGTESANEPPLFRADTVRVTIRIISAFKRRIDIQSAIVERPRANIIVYENGRTNFPTPRRVRERKREPVRTVLDLAIKRFNLTDGEVLFAMRRLPLNVAGENLRSQIYFDAAVPRYRGSLSFNKLNVKPGSRPVLPFDVDAQFSVAENVVDVASLRFGLKRSSVDLRGRVADFKSPRAEFRYALHAFAEDITASLGVRAASLRGVVDSAGEIAATGRHDYVLNGRLNSGGLAFQRAGIRLTNMTVDGKVVARPERIELNDFVAHALGGTLGGSASFLKQRDLTVEGLARGFSIHELTHFQGIEHADWNGEVSGPVRFTGTLRNGELRDVKASAQLKIEPAPGPNPVNGTVDVRYDRNTGEIDFGQSQVATRLSRLQFSGTLGRQLRVSATSNDLRDIEPAIALARGQPASLPVALAANGVARFEGLVTGSLKNPSMQGRVEMTNFTYAGRSIDRISADLHASKAGVAAQNLDVRKQQMHAAGWAQVGLANWKPDQREPVAGAFNVQAPAIEALLAETGERIDVTGGPVTADLNLSGTIGTPQIAGRVGTGAIVFYGQPIASVQTLVRFTEGVIEVSLAELRIGRNSEVRLSFVYLYPPENIRHGQARWEFATKGVPLARIAMVESRNPGLGGRIEAQMSGDIAFGASTFRIISANGWFAVRGVAYEHERLGSLLFTANTKGNQATLGVQGELVGATVKGNSEWSLSGDYPVHGAVEFTPLNFATLIERFRNMPGAGLPFDGFAAGRVEFSGATTRPQSWKGSAQIGQLELRPDPQAIALPNASDLVVRNVGPIVVGLDSKAAQVKQATLRGPDTDLTLTGRLAFGVRNPFDFRVRGQVNLALLREIEPRLYSSGGMALDVTLRGRPSLPDVFGRIDLKNAALNWPGFPNGIDNANGLIFLARDRATVESLTAETGGGQLSATGFIVFGGDTPTFSLDAKAEDVRVRYPAGVSSTANATVRLSGTYEASQLSGDAEIRRLGFNPRSDLASILASTSEPVQVPANPNRFLRGMRFNVHILTSPQVRLETGLTRDLQADADLRLRGTPIRPVLEGRIAVNGGEVLFFGNRYEIQGGQIIFANASKIEPIVNLDLTTRARGIEVLMHVSGPVNKLNMTYRSDPPLQFSEIVALLATGREPASVAGLTQQSQTPAQSWEQAGASALLSQALANPIAGRLQRFFGVSRLKIDPAITGVTTNAAAARVTLEQQITRNLTLTYITDLSRPQAQTIRIELDLTKNWSGVALREETGLFGVDFLYKKQFQ